MHPKSSILTFNLLIIIHIYFNSFIYQFFHSLGHGAHEVAIFMEKRLIYNLK